MSTSYSWPTYPQTGTLNFEYNARTAMSTWRENSIGMEQSLNDIEDWSYFTPGTLPGYLLIDRSLSPIKFDSSNTPMDGYVPVYYGATGKITWEDVSGVVGMDTYQVKWKETDGAAFLESFVATKEEAEAGISNERIMTPLRTNEAIGALLPAGMKGEFFTETAPDGWLECNGAAVSRTTYSRLFAAIGTMYGAGDGSTTFNLPNTQGLFSRHKDGGSGVDPDAAFRTDRGDGTVGDAVGTKQLDETKEHLHNVASVTGTTSSDGSHTHSFSTSSDPDPGGGSYVSTDFRSYSSYNTSSDGSHGHSVTVNAHSTENTGGNETRSKNISLLWCIKY